MKDKVQLYLIDEVHSAHRLVNTLEDSEWNRSEYGKCYDDIHGHSFKIEVWLDGEVSDRTGYVVNFGDIKSIIRRYDHRFLNDLFPVGKTTTAENFACLLLDEIAEEVLIDKEVLWDKIKITIWETERASATIERENENRR